MPDIDVKVSGMAVAIGMPIYGGIPSGTAMSLFRTTTKCVSAGIALDFINCAGSYVHISRDWIVDEFLKGDCQKLFFIDHDEAWSEDDFLRFVALSTRREVVVAAYPAKKDPPTFYLNCLPTAKSEEFGLIKIRGTGLGFSIIDRSVLERLAADAPRLTNPHTGKSMANIFRVDTIDGAYRGEDIAFFADVKNKLGIDVWMDPTVEIGHIGQHEWRGRISDYLKPIQKENTSDGTSNGAGSQARAGQAAEAHAGDGW